MTEQYTLTKICLGLTYSIFHNYTLLPDQIVHYHTRLPHSLQFKVAAEQPMQSEFFPKAFHL